METEANNEGETAIPTENANKMETNENETPEGENKQPAAAPQPKQILKSVDLQCDNKTSGINQQLLLDLTEREVSWWTLLKFFLPLNASVVFFYIFI